MRGIKVMTMGDVFEGMYIAEPDEDYPLDSIVPADHYDEAEVDWQHVFQRKGYVDLPTFTLAQYDGTLYTQRYQSSASVWVLVGLEPSQDGKGIWEPVVQDPTEV